MALPVDYNTVTVSGKFVYLNGNPVSGNIKFAGKIVAVSTATKTVIVHSEIIVPLDTNGAFSVELPATDDPDITPNGWTYTVTEQWPNGRTYEIDVPLEASVEGIDLSTVAPLPPASGDPTAFVTLSAFEALEAAFEVHTHEGGGGPGGTVAWDDVTGKPSTFPPSTHSHPISEVTSLQTALDDKSDTGHSHTIANVTDLQTALDDKSDVGHEHDIANVTGLQDELDAKADVLHGHAIGDVTDLQDELDGKSDIGHLHDIADVSGLQATLDDKVGAIHSHTISDVTDLNTELNNRVTGPSSATDNEVPRFDSTTGKLIQGSGVTLSDNKDLAGIRRITRTFAASIGTNTWIDRIDLDFAVDVPDPDLLRVYVQSALVFWMNENGFIRGTPRSSYKDDALVRGRARSDLTTQQGGYIELENSSSQLLHRRRWTDGALVRGNGSGIVVCADVVVLGDGDPIPAGTPTGTVIIRLEP